MARLSFEEIKQWAVDAADGYENKRGGVNFPCPVDDHPEPAPGEREQQASAWAKDDGTTGVKCWGGCDWRDLLANIEAAIAVSQPEEPAPPADGEDTAPKAPAPPWKVRRENDSYEFVVSRNGAGQPFTVLAEPGMAPVCDCSDFISGTDCEHIRALRQHMAARKPATPKAAPAPTQATNGAVRRAERENGHVEPTSDWAELRPRLIERWVEPKWTPIGNGQESAYVPVVAILDRLDALVGPENWQMACDVVGSGAVKVSLTILGVTREAIGMGESITNRQGEVVKDFSLKAAESDGLKRAASAFGIGRWVRSIAPRRAK